MIINPAKLIVITTLILAASILLGIDKIDTAVWVAICGPFAGIAVGNGINAKRGDAPAPLIDTANRQRRALDAAVADAADALAAAQLATLTAEHSPPPARPLPPDPYV